MAIKKSSLAGIILTGGRSTRMGCPKATVVLDGVPLWQWAGGALAPLVNDILFVGDPEGFKPTGRPIIADNPAAMGPLGGILTGLESSGYEHHLILAVDYPLVRSALLELLVARAGGVLAVCGRSASFLEPLLAYYHRECSPVIRVMIGQGEIRSHRLFERVPSYVLSEEEYNRADPARWSQHNVNTPEQLRAAEELLKTGYPM